MAKPTYAACSVLVISLAHSVRPSLGGDARTTIEDEGLRGGADVGEFETRPTTASGRAAR